MVPAKSFLRLPRENLRFPENYPSGKMKFSAFRGCKSFPPAI